MKKIILILFAFLFCAGVNAQKVVDIDSENQTIRWKLSHDELGRRIKERMKMTVDNAFMFEILPDTIYIGEPFELHYGIGQENRIATFEFYDCRGGKHKKMATKKSKSYIRGYAVVSVTFDEPGVYEIAAYDELSISQIPDPNTMIAREKITVHNRKSPPKE